MAWSQPSGAADLAYRLIGTIEGRSFTGAVLADSAGTQTVYRLGEQLPDGSLIVKVNSDSIRVKQNDGSFYELLLLQTMKTTGQQSKLPVNVPAVNSAPVVAPDTEMNNPGTGRMERPPRNVRRRAREEGPKEQ